MAKTNYKCKGTIDGEPCEGYIIAYFRAGPITDEQLREDGYLDSLLYECDTCHRGYEKNRYDDGYHPVS